MIANDWDTWTSSSRSRRTWCFVHIGWQRCNWSLGQTGWYYLYQRYVTKIRSQIDLQPEFTSSILNTTLVRLSRQTTNDRKEEVSLSYQHANREKPEYGLLASSRRAYNAVDWALRCWPSFRLDSIIPENTAPAASHKYMCSAIYYVVMSTIFKLRHKEELDYQKLKALTHMTANRIGRPLAVQLRPIYCTHLTRMLGHYSRQRLAPDDALLQRIIDTD